MLNITSTWSLNTITASWGGFGVLWGKNVAFIFIRPQRYTKEFVENSGYLLNQFFSPLTNKLTNSIP